MSEQVDRILNRCKAYGIEGGLRYKTALDAMEAVMDAIESQRDKLLAHLAAIAVTHPHLVPDVTIGADKVKSNESFDRLVEECYKETTMSNQQDNDRLDKLEKRIDTLEELILGPNTRLTPDRSPSIAPGIFGRSVCPKCGLACEGVMGYVCPNLGCPMGMGPNLCSTKG